MSTYGADKGRPSKPYGKFEHCCDDTNCKAWGTYGFKTKYGQLWFCREHKKQGEAAMAGQR